ncbi:hypothetical protein RDWZM_008788 [Blomia tropicalis]|uniref:Uncharacterized protein n=1 Tax=Blomia tropicalis TaxID=40697 RepID=A0A9Q0RLR6_BLOTA|nr:hypothetical protein RDWZM_008788 [Blomia tropicalis]
MAANLSDAEEGQIGQRTEFDAFNDKNIRNRFVQKVYSILSAQFLLTFAICAVCIFVESVKTYIQMNMWPMMTALVVYFVTGIMIMCCNKLQRTVPWNYILLTMLTISMSIMLGVLCAFADLQAVFLAAGITFAATLAISLFSCWTKFDFTKLIWIAAICGFVLCITGFIMIFNRNNLAQTIYSGGGALLVMLYLAIDTQLIMGGKRFQISEEDYIFAALNLYLDIVQLFIFILRILQASK